MTCINEDCKNETNEGYKYCMDCYKKWQAGEGEDLHKARPWHDNEYVDQLMKINNNLNKIVMALENRK